MTLCKIRFHNYLLQRKLRFATVEDGYNSVDAVTQLSIEYSIFEPLLVAARAGLVFGKGFVLHKKPAEQVVDCNGGLEAAAWVQSGLGFI